MKIILNRSNKRFCWEEGTDMEFCKEGLMSLFPAFRSEDLDRPVILTVRFKNPKRARFRKIFVVPCRETGDVCFDIRINSRIWSLLPLVSSFIQMKYHEQGYDISKYELMPLWVSCRCEL